MCIIVYLPANKTISKQQLENCYDHNRHGWGIMFAKDGKLEMMKDTTSFKDFYDCYQDVPRDAERAVHFRIKTSGLVNKENCHPFEPLPGLGLMHNGTIDTPLLEKEMNDTHNFAMHELRPMLLAWPDFMDDPNFEKLMDEVTGWSKLFFMNKEGKVLLTRKKGWIEREGLMYSHGGCFTAKYNSYSSGYSTDYGVGYNSNTRRSRYASGKNENFTQEDGETFSQSFGGQSSTFAERNTNRKGRNKRGKYHVLENQTADLNENNVKSDLYCGNKTDAEGRHYVARLEEERKEFDEDVLNKSVDKIIKRLNQDKTQSVMSQLNSDLDDEDQIQDEPAMVVDVDILSKYTWEELLEFIQDCPASAALTIRELIRVGFEGGIYDTVPVDDYMQNSAVSKT